MRLLIASKSRKFLQPEVGYAFTGGHSTNAASFEEWFKDTLLPALPHGQGYTVILDNASQHRRKVLKKLARGKVRVLFLPPYSPDYNPIEKSWANMKRFLRDNLRGFFMVDFVVYEYFALRNLT